jgi:arylsulfatase A-like enzyme
MTKKRLTRNLLLSALGALLLAGCSRPQDNVIVVVIDTLRQDHLATYGYARDPAPFLDQLARQGAVFEGLSPSSWTKPAVASLLSGLHPVRHQVFDRYDRLSPEAPLLAEQLRRQGYHTLGASANGWVSPLFGFDRGFERFLMHKEMPGKALNRRLFPLLDRLEPPFFLYVHYLDPHAPYNPEIGWDGQPLPAALRAEGPVTVADLDISHVRQLPAELLARAKDLYDGEIREADEALRELVEHLARRGLMDSTVLVVTSDHGEELEDHGRMGHGQTLYQEVLRVPLVVHAPHRFHGGQRLGRASLLDVVPTLSDWLDLKSEEAALRPDGISLAPTLAEGRAQSSTEPRAFLAHLDFEEGVGLALLKGDDKLVLEKARNELFDLRSDPEEKRDLLGFPGATPHLARLGTEMVDLYNTYAKARLDRSSVEIDNGLQQSLAALGYVAPDQEIRRRAIPHRLDLPAFGWPSWAPFGSGSSCARLGEAGAAPYLLQGWYGPEQGGRWSERQASLAMSAGLDRQRRRLMLIGMNHRPAPVRLRVNVDHQPVLETEVARGPFQLSVEVPDGLFKARSLMVLETDSAFVPSQHGGEDSRSLGLYWTTICLER